MTEHLELCAPFADPTPAERTAAWLRAATPARIFTGRAGSSYHTATLLALRGDHAAARDAVSTPLDLDAPGMAALADRFPWTVVATMADSRHRYLRRPDLGRRLTPQARQTIRAAHGPGPDVQLVIGDGLSSTAVHAQVPALLPLVHEGCAVRGWSVGRPIVVRQCRVGVLNEIGDLLDPAVVVLLIGERPGLATAESLSAYLAYRPRPGHTDADRNLLSNIHRAGIPVREAASRIVGLVEALMADGRSGVAVKEPAALES
ncbi:ethanolamine ammonia-lyase subunit EutC [Streptomyces monashensis]|uniref:ethanolamine ammonia-lyase subunit EutC n=1 Tax=Streptomyces monashensis TaxID=1678012 RepID=UPI000A54C049|nr:ethanolamine ammonia-lyase subunit EutC [Streptomyces monashensis]